MSSSVPSVFGQWVMSGVHRGRSVIAYHFSQIIRSRDPCNWQWIALSQTDRGIALQSFTLGSYLWPFGSSLLILMFMFSQKHQYPFLWQCRKSESQYHHL